MRRMMVVWMMALLVPFGAPAAGAPEESEVPETRSEERHHMVQRYIAYAGIADPETLEAMRRTPRHRFVPDNLQDLAYVDQPLPIGHGQTISQPYVVAFMTEALQLQETDRVLEVGTGSGYQAAVLAEIVDQVFTVEIIEALAESAEARLASLGYKNVSVRQGDGYYGRPEEAPFDAIIVTAAAGHIPRPLLDQLKVGGKLIIPVGPVYSVQNLILAEKRGEQDVRTENLLPVRFVPMTGQVQQ